MKINQFTIFSIFCFIIITLSCKNKTTEQPASEEAIQEVIETIFVDDSNAEETAADTSSNGVYQDKEIDEEISLKDALKKESEPKIEEGTMSFCDCVRKNKALNDTIMSDNISDSDFDKAMKELEGMKTGDCNIMFPNQSNIEEKEAHQKKVKRCLGK